MSAGVRADTISTIWSDGFESGNTDNWWTSNNTNWQVVSANSAYVHSGSYRVQVIGASEPNGDIMLLAESTLGWKNLELHYWSKATSDVLESIDHIYVEWSSDYGASWYQLADHKDTSIGNWRELFFALPDEASDNSLFQLRFRAVLSSVSDSMWFDDVSLSATPVPEPSTMILLFSGLSALLLFRKK